MSFYGSIGYDKILDYANARHTTMEIEADIITRKHDAVQGAQYLFPADLPPMPTFDDDGDTLIPGLKQAVMLHQRAIDMLESQLQTRAAYSDEPEDKRIDHEEAADKKIAKTYKDLITAENSFYRMATVRGYVSDYDDELTTSFLEKSIFSANLAADVI